MSLADEAVRAVAALQESWDLLHRERGENERALRAMDAQHREAAKSLEDHAPGCGVCCGPYPGPAMRAHMSAKAMPSIRISLELWAAWEAGCCSVQCKERLPNPEGTR